MDAVFLREWAGLVAVLISIGGALYAWLTTGAKANADHLRKVEDRLGQHEKRIDRNDGRLEGMIPKKQIDDTFVDHGRRIDRLENEMAHLPSKDMVNDLKLAVTEIRGDMHVLREASAAVQRTANRIENFLMKDK